MNERNERALALLLGEAAAASYQFVAPTPETHRRVNARPGGEQARDLRDALGWSRPFAPSAVGPRIFDLLTEADAIEPVGPLWKSRVRIASLNGALYLHSAFPTTAADSVFFGPDTYRFVRSALAALPARAFSHAIDVGCGAGAGGLAVAQARLVDRLSLTDINPVALAFARINAAHQNRPASFAISDLFASVEGPFDLILANPPYLADPAGRTYRDGGGPLGLDLARRIAREGIDRLAPGGVLFLYTGAPIVAGVDQLRRAVEQTMPRDGFIVEYSEIDPDVFGEELDAPAYREVDRITVVALKITRTRHS